MGAPLTAQLAKMLNLVSDAITRGMGTTRSCTDRNLCPLGSHAGAGDDELSCELEVVHLKEQENSYTVLLYVWGNPRKTTSCICGGRSARITVNLAEALRALRDPKTALRLWADAICINQAEEVAEITGPLNVIRLTDIFRDVHLSYQNE